MLQTATAYGIADRGSQCNLLRIFSGGTYAPRAGCVLLGLRVNTLEVRIALCLEDHPCAEAESRSIGWRAHLHRAARFLVESKSFADICCACSQPSRSLDADLPDMLV